MIPAEGPGVAREKKGKKIDFFFDFFSLCHPRATHECPQKNSAYLVQPFGRPEGTYTRMSSFIR